MSVFAQAYRDAESAGASEAQLTALAEADRSGDLSYGVLIGLIGDTFTCLDDTGIPYLPITPLDIVPGYSIPDYAVGTNPDLGVDASFVVAAGCQSRHSEFAERAYQWQPRAQEHRDQALEAQLPEVIECLEDHGVALDADAPLDEYRRAVGQVAYDTSLTGSAVVCSTY